MLDVTGTLPDEVTFARAHRVGRSLPLVLECGDTDWDMLALLEALPRQSRVFLLDTPGGPADLEQRTFLCWDPEWELVLHGGTLERRNDDGRVVREPATQPLANLRASLRAEGAAPVPYDTGFSGGLVGFVSYDFKNHLERLPDSVRDDLHTPELRLAFVRRVVCWDHRARRLTLRVHHRCRSRNAHTDWLRALDAAHAFRDEVLQLVLPSFPRGHGGARAAARVLSTEAAATPRRAPRRLQVIEALRSNLDRDAYDTMLARAREHILAGHIYQANLSHRFAADFGEDGVALYRRLRQINPSPFATYMRFPEHELVSCSPERLVRLHDGRVETRPIAGTRPRGVTHHEDSSLERELLGDEKEGAEHLMIVDMARNDIGRVCDLGSVQVERFMSVERYSHVRHLVSNVAGRLDARRDAFDVLAATFPGASITGVPKVRCMQVIDELEQFRRGVYTGSAGYFGLDGAMDLNILIRTFFLQSGRAYFNVGGGIVADSKPESEYRETLAKAGALLEALRPAASRGVWPSGRTAQPVAQTPSPAHSTTSES